MIFGDPGAFFYFWARACPITLGCGARTLFGILSATLPSTPHFWFESTLIFISSALHCIFRSEAQHYQGVAERMLLWLLKGSLRLFGCGGRMPVQSNFDCDRAIILAFSENHNFHVSVVIRRRTPFIVGNLLTMNSI